MLSFLRCLVRIPRVMLHFLIGIYKIQDLKRKHGEQWYAIKLGRKAIRQWMDEACDILGLKVTIEGAVPQHKGELYVANHVSWLDILAIASVTDCKFLSKATVRHWPVIGWFTASIGCLFIRRHNRRAFHKSLQRVKERLQDGENVCIFPEGTTSDGRQVLPFHSGLLQAAIDAEAAIQPMVLKYVSRDGSYEEHAPYYGRDVFLIHMLRLLGKRETHLTLSFLPAMPQQAGADRQMLARVLEQRFSRDLASNVTKLDTQGVLDTSY